MSKKSDHEHRFNEIYLKSLHQVTEALSDEWLRPKEIAAKLGLSTSHVSLYLTIAQRNGLAELKCAPDKRSGLHPFYRRISGRTPVK